MSGAKTSILAKPPADARLAHLGAVLRRRALAGSLVALALGVGGTGMTMSISLMAARSTSPQGFGHLATSFNDLSFRAVLAVMAVLCRDVVVARSWAEQAGVEAHGLVRGACTFGRTVVIAAFVAFGALTFAQVPNLHDRMALPQAARSPFLATRTLVNGSVSIPLAVATRRLIGINA